MNTVDNHFAIQYQVVQKIKKMVTHEIEHLGMDREDEEGLIVCMNFVLDKILNEKQEPEYVPGKSFHPPMPGGVTD